MGFHTKHKCIVITPQGFTTVAARALLRKLWKQLRGVPIYGLVNLNSAGALILSTFMIGSITRAFDNLDLSVPPIRWICVLPSDVTGLKHIPTTPVSSRDRTTLKNLHHLYHSDKSKRTQAGIFVDLLKNEYNMNIDTVIDYYGGIEQYLIPKIPEMVVIKKKSKKKIQETQLVEV